ncbi:MAG TPA: tRNA glutamyl-Q(34) synthetase GluQRS [Gallionella sp.]|nr:tRNA glutamyl-Q(34) synthetase GluQRS [Gallionella sp.]
MSVTSQYHGRFAPSPTGPLHFGSLVTAVGSYLEAKKHHGIWLLRMEDLDTPRCVAGAADDILRTLEAFGLYWDEAVLYQSQRTAAYQEALEQLKQTGMAYPCACTRREIADSALFGIEGQIYPGTCRAGIATGRQARAWRVRTDGLPSSLVGEGIISFDDALQGRITQELRSEIGDFVVLRADGLFAYQLAAVVDDAFQGINHIVRGADLITSTARQIWLQRLLGYPTPNYMHLPIAVNAQGEKLSKQTLAAPVDRKNCSSTLLQALRFLRQNPPVELAGYEVGEILNWAVAHWDSTPLDGIMRISI